MIIPVADSTYPTGIPAVDIGRLIADRFHNEPAEEGEWLMQVTYAVNNASYTIAYASEDAAKAALAALAEHEKGELENAYYADFTALGCHESSARVYAA